MKTYTQEQLKEILDKHSIWLQDHSKGERANLSYANLYNANLYNANLSNSDLSYANLYNANLSNSDLSYANLSGADLSDANLSDSNLSQVKGIYSFNLGKHQAVAWKDKDILMIKIGCKELSATDWIEKGREIGKKEGYSLEERLNYKSMIKCVIKCFNREDKK